MAALTPARLADRQEVVDTVQKFCWCIDAKKPLSQYPGAMAEVFTEDMQFGLELRGALLGLWWPALFLVGAERISSGILLAGSSFSLAGPAELWLWDTRTAGATPTA